VRVCVASAHRNSAGRQISRWISQIIALRDELRNHYYCGVRAVAVEGDSTDTTRAQLTTEAEQRLAPRDIEFELATCNHGGPVYGSTEQPERMAALSKVGNAVLDAVRATDDVLVYVESDLVWDAETIRRLIDRVLGAAVHRVESTWDLDAVDDCDVWVPVVMAGDTHYDCWAYRTLDGSRIFHPFPFTAPTELSSAGSCLVMPAAVARDKRARMETGALVEWCEKARAAGYRIAVDPALIVRHPA